MNPLRRSIEKTPLYFLYYLVSVLIAVLFVSAFSRTDSFLRLNVAHTDWLNYFFIPVTFLGDGLFSIILALFLFLSWKGRRLAVHIIIAYLVSGLLAQLIKRILQAPRPKAVLLSRFPELFIPGMNGDGCDSFPSGHTTSIFALATILALHIGKTWAGLLFLFMAMLVGYSRIYLGQHFPEDVLAGSILGTMTSLLVYSFVQLKGKLFWFEKPGIEMRAPPSWATDFGGHEQA